MCVCVCVCVCVPVVRAPASERVCVQNIRGSILAVLAVAAATKTSATTTVAAAAKTSAALAEAASTATAETVRHTSHVCAHAYLPILRLE